MANGNEDIGMEPPIDVDEIDSTPAVVEYIITTDRKTLEKYQAEADAQFGYPENLKSLRYVGVGIHAPKELGRAMHYHPIMADKTGKMFALPAVESKVVPVDCEKKPLPDDWYEDPMKEA
jgi:hypothetical protein